MNILQEIAYYAKERVLENSSKISLKVLRDRALSLPAEAFPFRKALAKQGMSFICECKKASPSKGIISMDFPYIKIAKEYEVAGADCISVITEPKYFLGSDEYLKNIACKVQIPCLRKDFIVDEYMLYEAKVLGASAVLLISSLLSKEQLKDYLAICEAIGLDALVETNNAMEIETAIDSGAMIIGVNNRNLKDFTVDMNQSKNLRFLVPEKILFVAESGIRCRQDVSVLKEASVDAVLIGEAMMLAQDKKRFLQELRDA